MCYKQGLRRNQHSVTLFFHSDKSAAIKDLAVALQNKHSAGFYRHLTQNAVFSHRRSDIPEIHTAFGLLCAYESRESSVDKTAHEISSRICSENQRFACGYIFFTHNTKVHFSFLRTFFLHYSRYLLTTACQYCILKEKIGEKNYAKLGTVRYYDDFTD